MCHKELVTTATWVHQLHRSAVFAEELGVALHCLARRTCLRVLPIGLDWYNLVLEPASVTSLGSSLV